MRPLIALLVLAPKILVVTTFLSRYPDALLFVQWRHGRKLCGHNTAEVHEGKEAGDEDPRVLVRDRQLAGHARRSRKLWRAALWRRRVPAFRRHGGSGLYYLRPYSQGRRSRKGDGHGSCLRYARRKEHDCFSCASFSPTCAPPLANVSPFAPRSSLASSWTQP